MNTTDVFSHLYFSLMYLSAYNFAHTTCMSFLALLTYFLVQFAATRRWLGTTAGTYSSCVLQFFFFSRTDEESVERKASRKEREGRARKGAKTTEGQGKHYGTSQLEQRPYSRGKRESVPQTHLPARQAQRTKVPRVPHPHVHSVSHGKDARGHVQIRV